MGMLAHETSQGKGGGRPPLPKEKDDLVRELLLKRVHPSEIQVAAEVGRNKIYEIRRLLIATGALTLQPDESSQGAA